MNKAKPNVKSMNGKNNLVIIGHKIALTKLKNKTKRSISSRYSISTPKPK